ncbi:MAG: ABC transporter permease [Anaerotruncus massiliensis (ex Togo et al. 2019)]
MWNTIEQMAPYAVGYTVPILITALGPLLRAQRHHQHRPRGADGHRILRRRRFGLLLRAVDGQRARRLAGHPARDAGGHFFSVLHAFASINLNADQTISGTAINLMAGALVLYISRRFVGTGNIVVNSMTRVDIPVLKDIPVVGKLFLTDTYPTTWFVLAILIVSWFVIERTPFGLRLRSCGEFPEAADAAGITGARIRYAGVLLSGACAGLGGAIYTVTTAGQCNGSVDGLGFLALAGLIFGQWKPFRILAATLFFGFAVTMAQISMLLPSFASVPPLALKVFPYVVTMLALVVFSKSSQAPRAEGKFFEYKKT